MDLIDCEKQRMNLKQYEVGGSFWNLTTYSEQQKQQINEFVKNLTDKYNSSGCGKDPVLEKCLERELYMQNLETVISEKFQQNNPKEASSWLQVLSEEKKKFTDLGCVGKVQQTRNLVLEEKLNKYSALDKERIEADSKYQANKKIFIGFSTFLIVVALITVIKSK